MEKHVAADRIFIPEQVFHHRVSQHANRGGRFHVGAGEKRSQAQVPAADLQKFRSDSAIHGRPVLSAIDHLDMPIHVRRDELDEWDLFHDRVCIGEHQGSAAARPEAHAVAGAAACFHPNKVVSQAL